MDKIKRYLECYIPTETCNLRCHYCYIALLERFNNKIAHFTNPPSVIRQALSVERLGGTCLINLCAGGETLLSEEVIELIEELLKEGHYLTVVTNGTLSKRFDQIAKFKPELLERLFFKFSFHYLELKRINMMDEYFKNIMKMKDAGCSFTVEVTPSDELIPHIDDLKKISMDKLGALPHITIARDDRTKRIDVLTKYSFEEYKKIWGQFDSNLFEYKTTIFYKKRKEFCYAGEWSTYIDLVTGRMTQCYCESEIDNIFKDINKPLKFTPVGNKCKQPHCYNGHSFLALGDIPQLNAPTLADLRNRKCSNGDEWLNSKMKNFMSQKLVENNIEYSACEKIGNRLENTIIKGRNLSRKVINKVAK
ncbi:MAG: radical SAM protein [Clostridiaceae bacterium]|nr:radical SAM protein [Clostridiaceae bacterium]